MNWIKKFFSPKPLLCRSCAEHDFVVGGVVNNGAVKAFATGHLCGKDHPEFPRSTKCVDYRYTLFYGDAE